MPGHKRYPIRHFFIMNRIQRKWIFRVFLTVFSVTLMTLGSVVMSYFFQYEAGHFYFLGPEVSEDLIRYTVWAIVLPSVVPSFLLATLLGLLLALYSSRKIAVPIYKIRVWSDALFSGDLTYRVRMRKGDDLEELESACNQVSNKFNATVETIKGILDGNEDNQIGRIKETIEDLKLVNK